MSPNAFSNVLHVSGGSQMWGTVESTRVNIGPFGNANKILSEFEFVYQID